MLFARGGNSSSMIYMNRKLNIIMIGTGMNLQGGISEVETEYFRAGLDKKVNVIFVPSHSDGSFLFCKLPIFLKGLKTYLLLPKLESTIVHFHMSHGGSFWRKLIFLMLAKSKQQKVIVHLHGSDFGEFMYKSKIHTLLTRYLFNKSDHIIVLSNLWKDLLSKFSTNRNITTLYNPIAKKHSVNRRDGNLKVLFMGRLGTRKGIYDLLEMISQNKDYFIEHKIEFILAGDGEVDKVIKIVQKNALEKIIEVPGWVSGNQKEAYLESSHIFILPSYNEQMPMSILEAMSYGYPVLATNVAGIPEMVEHGVNGFLFTPGDIDALVQNLKTLCEETSIRNLMGIKSRQLVNEKFESHLIINKLVDLYQDIACYKTP